MLLKNVLQYGKEDSLPESVILHAGALQLYFEPGEIRYVKWGEREIIRRVYAAVRDQNWGTIQPVYTNLDINDSGDHFSISFNVKNLGGEIDFAWKGTISGQSDGTLNFSMEGKALSNFLKNRIGFCVLYPASCAGHECIVGHGDGKIDKTRFPVEITAEQPVRPFQEIDTLIYQFAEGCQAKMGFYGDVFEMEDQRNWTDASYKVYCTPQSIPYPVEIKAGTTIKQTITLSIQDETHGEKQIESAGGSFAEPGEAILTASSHPLPLVGFSIASHGSPLTDLEITRLQTIRPHHLRVDLVLSDPKFPHKLELATTQAQQIGTELEAAIFLSAQFHEELDRLKLELNKTKPPIASWLVYPEKEYLRGGSPIKELVQAVKTSFGEITPSVKIAAGTNSDFIFLQRNLPPLDLIEMVCVAINPQVHSTDNSSIVETLEAQTTVIANTKRIADKLPVTVSPITLKPRFNPYATSQASIPPSDVLPPEVDERQMSLFCAGWTAASYAAVAKGGAASVTYYETTGWRGVMETESGSPLPKYFRSIPGGVYPVYHVLADIAEFIGGQVVDLEIDNPLQLGGLDLCLRNNAAIILANFTSQPQHIRLPAIGKLNSIRNLDETNVTKAMKFPDEFRKYNQDYIPNSHGPAELDLLPFAVTRLNYII